MEDTEIDTALRDHSNEAPPPDEFTEPPTGCGQFRYASVEWRNWSDIPPLPLPA